MDPGFKLRTMPQARRVETRVNALMALHRIRDPRNVFSPRSTDLPVEAGQEFTRLSNA
jgi:hypothetical protein